MGQFTMTLQEVLEQIEDAGENPVLYTDGPNAYPIFDESYRQPLNKKILDHFMFYEIGQETVEMFRFTINRKLREIMPYYNQMYRSQSLIIDPFQTIKMSSLMDNTSDTTSDSHSTSSQDSTTGNTSRAVSSDFPQTRLMPDGDYATGATDSTGTTTVEGSGTGDTSQNGHSSGSMTNETTGSQGHVAALLDAYRATFLNIDMMVLRDLVPCFMQIFDNGDEFATTRGMIYARPYYGTYAL